MRLRGLISGYPFCVTEGTRGMKEAYGTEGAGAVAKNVFGHSGHMASFLATLISRYRFVTNQWPKSGHGGQQVAKTLATSLSQNSNEKSVFAALGGHHF
nr:MAG TPA: hypothetical protein [Caudoviricetes sp.]